MQFPKYCLLIFSFFLTVSSFSQTASVPDLKIEGFVHPESVVSDEQRKVVYVSNIGNREPGDGFISKISEAGEIINLKWISGLNDPKGLLVNGNKLYVTDNTELVEMDIDQGRITRRISVPGAQFLNDVAIDDAGTLFISDTGKSSIFSVDPSGNVVEWINDANLEKPNGLLVDGDAIFVAAWGDGQPGNILKVDKDSREIEKITDTGIGNLDGIQKIDANSFYISDWADGKIYQVRLNGSKEEVLTSEKSAGDILYLESGNRLFLPMNHQNQVWIFELK